MVEQAKAHRMVEQSLLVFIVFVNQPVKPFLSTSVEVESSHCLIAHERLQLVLHVIPIPRMVFLVRNFVESQQIA